MLLLVETKTNSAYRKNCFINAYLIRRYTGLTGQLAFMKIISIYIFKERNNIVDLPTGSCTEDEERPKI